MKRVLIVCAILVVIAGSVSAREASATLKIEESWSCVFGGKVSVFHASVVAARAFKGRMHWEFSTSGRTIARGESQINILPADSASIELSLAVPAVKPAVMLRGLLSVSLHKEAGEDAVAGIEKDIWIFGDDPFVNRKKWLGKIGIRLFDPGRRTATLFGQAGIPFRQVSNIDSFPSFKEGILVIGEGVSFRDYRGLPEAMVRTAASGVPVLCFAPTAGKVVLPGMGGSDLPAPASISLRRADIIGELDKRLDSKAWPADGIVAGSSMKLTGQGGPVVAEIVDGDSDWLWLAMDFDNENGKMLVCTFAVVDKWESGPVPRFLLAKLLERMTGTGEMKQQTKGETP